MPRFVDITITYFDSDIHSKEREETPHLDAHKCVFSKDPPEKNDPPLLHYEAKNNTRVF